MKRIFILALAIPFLLDGCSLLPSSLQNVKLPANETPVAYIDAITPPTATAGEDITLVGHGTDADGTVVAYRWRSNLDGPLGVSASITTSELSVGEHDIYFKVQDNTGDWSREAVNSVTITPVEVLIPLDIVSFTSNYDTIHLGDTVTLSWEVAGADEVSIEPDIGSVNQAGIIDITPEETTEYTLTATKGSETKYNSTEITVLEPDSYSETLSVVESNTSSIFGDDPPALWPPGQGISVGDFSTDIPVQGFVTFDISDIPSDAIITSVEVDFSSYSTGGTPFADLGCLRVYPQSYGTLKKGDFYTGSATGSILRYCSEAEIMPHESESVRDALQDSVGHNRFQVRFQFNEEDTDNNGDQDYIHWDNNELILHIEYESYQ
ncbi:MAG: hypothetical protein J7L19_06310 [Dehalococcoidia bacterium]|nr:hypothetical protein [Dehalococcoidia bacterium]